MTRSLRHLQRIGLLGAGLALAACEDKKPDALAPVASTLAPSAPKAEAAVAFAIESASSKVGFEMQAPIEKITGEAPGSVSGELFLDLTDVTRSTGLVKVDLEKLTLYQERRDDEQGAFGERKKNDLQNEHARTWLEISPDTPADVRAANRYVEFRVEKVENPSTRDLTGLPGEERTLTAEIVGDFRLHGRKNPKRAKVELRLRMAGDRPESLAVRTLEPLAVGLEEYDVRPREAFGKLAQKTLGALGSKVAASAPLEVEFAARPK